ncbi:MAG: hypothetical protein AAGI17_04445 [Planctomycetota bacterium]
MACASAACGLFCGPAFGQPAETDPSRVVFWGDGTRTLTIEDLSLQGPIADPAQGPIAWDRVRTVIGPLADEFEQRYKIEARDVWRAASRLERGDTAGAEPLFERLFEIYSDGVGPTSALIAEGLMRCRLGRGAVAPAIEAWTALLSACGNDTVEASRDRYEMRAILDPETGLVPTLSPVFRESPTLEALAQLDQSGIVGEPAAIMKWYRAAALHELGRPTGLTSLLLELPERPDPGLDLVSSMVRARIDGPSGRAEARERLVRLLVRARSSEETAWMVAWCHAGIGRSLIEEEDAGLRRLGVSRLVLTHVTSAEVAPLLAGTALADAADVLESDGDAEGAGALRELLDARYPSHPATRLTSRTGAP